MTEENSKNDAAAPVSAGEYTAPKIEEVVTRDTLEREAAYAGNIISGGK